MLERPRLWYAWGIDRMKFVFNIVAIELDIFLNIFDLKSVLKQLPN